jgi:mono/diheme cytochrome c family protein
MTRSAPLAALLLAAACSGETRPLSAAAERGREVYLSVCIACHAADPTRDGSAGPAVAGSSRELIEARVVRGTYPPAYTPKRPSAVMPAFPNLAPHVDDLAAFLAEAGGAGGH